MQEQQHKFRVSHIQTQIRSRGTSKIAISSKGRVGHCVRLNSWKKNCYLIDVSKLNNILNINVVDMNCSVEPGITFEHLCQETLKVGLLPLVIPEFKNITIGGAILGLGVESSSFRHGLFEDSVQSIDVVNGKGTIISCNSKESSDLFYGMFGSYGMFGVLVRCTVRLMPATSNVRVSYRTIVGNDVIKEMAEGKWFQQVLSSTVTTVKKDAATIKKDENVDFCEAILYTKQHAVVITAEFETNETAASNVKCWCKDFSHFRFYWGRWFYQHAKLHLREWNEIVPTIDYLFRHDRGIFWCAEVRGVGTSMCERMLNGWYWSSSTAYQTEHESKTNNDFFRIVQDIAIPITNQRLERFLNVIDTTLNVYPLWLCPIKNQKNTTSQKIFSLPSYSKGNVQKNVKKNVQEQKQDHEQDHENWYVNVGIYGAPLTWDGRPFHLSYVTAHRALENTTKRMCGRKGLYSTSYYTKKEFNQEYNMQRVDLLCQKYAMQCCVDIFTKCCEPIHQGNKKKDV